MFMSMNVTSNGAANGFVSEVFCIFPRRFATVFMSRGVDRPGLRHRSMCESYRNTSQNPGLRSIGLPEVFGCGSQSALSSWDNMVAGSFQIAWDQRGLTGVGEGSPGVVLDGGGGQYGISKIWSGLEIVMHGITQYRLRIVNTVWVY